MTRDQIALPLRQVGFDETMAVGAGACAADDDDEDKHVGWQPDEQQTR